MLVRYNSVFVPLCSPNTCKDVFNPNVTAFQSNCAEGLHFSAFHCNSNNNNNNNNNNCSNYRDTTYFIILILASAKILVKSGPFAKFTKLIPTFA